MVTREMSGLPEVSVVVPCQNEEGNVALLVESIRRSIGEAEEYEVILVDDGSTDRTWTVITDQAKAFQNVIGLRLTRAFGHQAALIAGLSAARGMAVITMDADLQHPPATLPALLQSWRSGSKIVNTQRIDAGETGLLKRWTSRWFYKVFSRLSGVSISPGSSDFRLLDRKVVATILAAEEGEYFLRGLVNWMGFPSATIPFAVGPRHSGRSAYSPRRMARLAISAVVSFSIVPLRLGVAVGLLTAVLAFAYLLFVLVAALAGRTVPGWASAVGVTTLLFGVQFILIGLVGEYLGRVHMALKRRPTFIVSEYTQDLAVQSRRREPDPDLEFESSR
jgi:dolichol-phosphate mannosyltransferase